MKSNSNPAPKSFMPSYAGPTRFKIDRSRWKRRFDSVAPVDGKILWLVARKAAWYCALGFALHLASSCASVPAPHPTPERPIMACVISCPEGFTMRQQHLCRSARRWLLDVRLTGEDDRPGDPSESRWFTGLTSYGADYITRERLRLMEGLIPPCPESPAGQLAGKKCSEPAIWAERYSATMKEVQHEMGDEAKAAYNKQDVLLESCDSFKRRTFLTMSADQRGVHPGETDPVSGQPAPPK
jgi:hypothetical protein